MKNLFNRMPTMLCMAFEEDMEAQAVNDGKVDAKAVALAKEKMAQEDLERDAREVARRLRDAEQKEMDAVREGRYASKKKNILKQYSDELKAARVAFEASGDWKTYDKKIHELNDKKYDDIEKAKEEVYGDEAWRYRN